MIYKDALKYGFYENLKLIELYSSLKGKNDLVTRYCYKTVLQLIYPIVPGLSKYLLDLKFNGEIKMPECYDDADDKIEAFDHVRNVCSKINSTKKKSSEVAIRVGSNFSEWKRESMKLVDSCSSKPEIVAQIGEVFKKHQVNEAKGMIFAMDYFGFNEYDTLVVLKDYIEECCALKVSTCVDDAFDPLSPGLKFK